MLFLKSGGVLPILLMLPNVVWIYLHSTDERESPSISCLLTFAENIGRLAVLTLPFFYSIDVCGPFSEAVATVMALTLAFYYACWIRYFAGGQSSRLLRKPMLGIPLPMAAAPAVFLIISSYLLRSWPMAIASAWFGIAHLRVSWLTLER